MRRGGRGGGRGRRKREEEGGGGGNPYSRNSNIQNAKIKMFFCCCVYDYLIIWVNVNVMIAETDLSMQYGD